MELQYNNKTVEATPVDVLTSNEHWNEYQLANGTILLTKTVLIEVYKILNEKAPDGEDIYITKTKGIVKYRS